VARYRLETLALLARQLEFAPVDVRLTQLAAAETLLAEIDVAKTYPIDFVIFRVTGFTPQSVAADLLAGAALQHDLCLLIESVSETLELTAVEMAEPVLTIEDVTARFNVTSKTIQRWRKRGLVSRRFLFSDGKKRVGFLLSSIERFVRANSETVERGSNFSQMEEPERLLILAHARRLAVKCSCCVREITRRIARRFNRSPLTILHTIRKHDQLNAESSIFDKAAADVKETSRARIVRGARKRIPLTVLAQKVHRTRAAVYRVIVDDRIERLTKRRVKFHDDPIYHQDGAEQLVDDIVRSGDLSVPAKDPVRIPKGLPPYLADLYRTPLLTPQQERALFLKFNFHKFTFVQARRRFEPELARKRDLDSLEACARKAAAVKSKIVTANLRLVVSVARKHLQPGLNLMELISEGNLVLMRAVESFDIHKNIRFSTYATFALMKGFARSIPEMRAKARGTGIDAALDVADVRTSIDVDLVEKRDQLTRLFSVLSQREREVLSLHYGLDAAFGGGLDAGFGGRIGAQLMKSSSDDESTDSSAPTLRGGRTLEDLGQQLGMTKHRVRQIEQTALAKLRHAAGLVAQ
jgi:RNA polymerase primary sigma factor